ncbi:hypothetical protein GZH47_30170 [Paenibacillus rhizovicinus]|uniref:Uncharacterized protein n=1 Tax=Paenibacillus rhizovicinus TaxID=2704463 RepID=A0A6C0P848_9BACL|nr:hypothetical protein [Paenibacillus rhizovicinus]QHW34639.1 hypothetical protein GZH47_30170 [Paenibacillus rhizovicinus]
MKLYFRDNFFNAGVTEIVNQNNERAGEVDLRSLFGSGLDVFDESGSKLFSGGFPLLSGKWVVKGPSGEECGLLRARMSFFSKRYEYEAYERGVYEITAGAFSQEYEIVGEDGGLAASFSRVSGFFEASAYCLDNRLPDFSGYEWIAVILGMHEIQKRRRNVSNTM